ncbi:M20 family peptidase, partial [Haloarcula sp. AONF1]
ISTVEFALGTDTLHAPDEYVPVDALVDNAVVYTRLPAAWRAEMDG